MAKKKKHKNNRPAPIDAKETPPVVKMSPKAKVLLALGALTAASSVFITMGAAHYIAEPAVYYNWLKAAYGAMALGGAIILFSTKYNAAKNRLNIQMVGLAFLVIGLGNVVGQFLTQR